MLQVGNAPGVVTIGIVFYGAPGSVQSQSQTSAHSAYPLAFGTNLVYLMVLAVAVAALLRVLPRNRQQ